MGDVIIFSRRKQGLMRMKNKKFLNIVATLGEKNANNFPYSLADIDGVASDILNSIDYYPISGATPIVKIVQDFDFVTYKIPMATGYSGRIYINKEDQTEIYKSEKVILVNKEDDLYHQRFVLAHELAHYLFDYLGHEDAFAQGYENTYQKDHHTSDEEKRTNRFAAELLMPKQLFIQQYRIAKKSDSNMLFIVRYLSAFFKTTTESIIKRIEEVLA